MKASTRFKRASAAFLVMAMLVTLISVIPPLTAEAASPSSGYVNSNPATDVVQYSIKSNTTIDVNGYYNGSWIKTTFNNNGYTYMTSVSSGSMTVAQAASIVQGGKYVKLSYTVTAGATGVTNAKLGIHADVQIRNNDSATITTVRDANGAAVGMQMSDGAGAQYRIYFNGIAGVTPASTYWMGRYNDRQSNCFTQTGSSSLSGTDSGIAVSWQGITLAAGESKTFSVLLGAGAVQQNIVVPPTTTDSFSLLGKYADAAKFDVSMDFTDGNSGATDYFYYSVDGGEDTLITSASATGFSQRLSGTVDLTGISDGEHTLAFWVRNDSGAISTAINRTIMVENGAIISGLDGGCVNVDIKVGESAWAEGKTYVKVGSSLSDAVANGSYFANGTYNIYVKNHLVGAVTVNGGYTHTTLEFASENITDAVNAGSVNVYEGTDSADVSLPETVYITLPNGISFSVRLNWLVDVDVYETEGIYMVYATATEIVGHEELSLADVCTFTSIFATVNVLHKHTYETVITPPTCTQAGERTDVCDCGHEITSYVPPLGHEYRSEVTKEATCQEDGIITYTCIHEGCEHSYTIAIHTEHNYVMNVVEPTCDEDGATIYTCTKCGDINKIVIPKAHTYVSEVTKPATREEDGEVTYTCSACGHSYTEVIPASNANVLVIQDKIPWNVNNIPKLLSDMQTKGYISGWSMTSTAEIVNLNLGDYDVILVANDQTTATYNQLLALEAKLSEFVSLGGTLIYGAADHGWSGGNISYNILGQVEKTNFYSMRNYIVDANHPIVMGSLTDDKALTNDLLLGTYCSHSGFKVSTLPEGYNVILQDAEGNATLAEYPMGAGKVIVSGLTWEFYYSRIYTGSTSYSMNVFDDLICYAVNNKSACDHKYDEGVTVDPTCATEGYVLHTCLECGASYKDTYVPALGHELGEWITDSEPTCATPGSRHQTCAVCGEEIVDVIPVIGHTYVRVETPATCTTSGTGKDVCECGDIAYVYYIPALGHDYATEITKVATCTEDGVITYTCKTEGCGHSYTVITHAEHDFVLTVIEPTCTKDGATVYTCNDCGHVNKITIPAAHNYVSEVVKPATREEDGEVKYTCSVCGDAYSEVIPASNANVLVIQDKIPWSVNNIPTLLNDMKEKEYISGWSMTTTAKIGELDLNEFDVILIANDQTTATYNQLLALDGMLSEFVKLGGTLIYGAADHGWASGDISYNILGQVEKTDCYSMRNYIVDLTHPIVTGSLTDDKALTNDLLLGTYCSHSGFKVSTLPEGYNVILQDSEGNATLAEYPMGEGKVIVSGLTWEFYYSRIYTGVTSYSMNVFDDLICYAVNPQSSCVHKYDDGVTVEATCTTEGYVLHTCAVCGSSYKDNYVSALGHEMGEWVTDSEANCTESGSRHQTCTRCGEEIIDVTPALGHNYTVKDEVDSTCTNAGYTVYECECGDEYTANKPMLGHELVHHAAKAPTTTEAGWEAYDTCENCDYSTYKEIPMIDMSKSDFVLAFNAISRVSFAEQYSTMAKAINEYKALNEMEKMGVKDIYEQLLVMIDEYNAQIDLITKEHNTALETVVDAVLGYLNNFVGILPDKKKIYGGEA